MKTKLLNKWYDKVMSGVEGYEGISCEKGKLIHFSEFHVAELEVVGIKLWKQGQLVRQEVWDLNEGNVGEELKILIKRCAELIITTDLGKTVWYFGDNSKYHDVVPVTDEILIYIQGRSGSYLVHGRCKDKISYLANIGAGDAFELMRRMFETWSVQEVDGNDDATIILA